MIDNFNIGFKNQMFVYAAETTNIYGGSGTPGTDHGNRNPIDKLKVCVPEAFLDKPVGKASSKGIPKGDTNIFLNTIKPSLTPTILSYNYITLPINTSKTSIRLGERFLAEFIANSPENGFIIARG